MSLWLLGEQVVVVVYVIVRVCQGRRRGSFDEQQVTSHGDVHDVVGHRVR